MSSSAQHFDVIVIGSGAVGLSVANELVQQSLKIALISPQEQDGVASLAAGAMIDAFGEIETLHSEYEHKKLCLEVEAQRCYPEWLKSITERSGKEVFQRQGLFIIGNNGGDFDQDRLKLMREQLKVHAEAYEQVDPREVPGLKPNIQYPAYDALFIKEAMTVDTTELLPALEEAIKQSGSCERINDRAIAVEPEHRDWQVTTQNHGILQGARVVVCAGAHSFKIIGEALQEKAGLPALYFGRGSSCTVVDGPEIPYCIRTPNRALACGIHMLPRARNRVYFGANNLFGTDFSKPKGPSCGELHTLFDAIMNQLNTSLRNASIETSSWGLRPVTAFDRPLAGETNIPGLFVATGTHRTGVHLSPILAQLVCSELLGKKMETSTGKTLDENLFSPKENPQISYKHDITHGIRSLIATALFPDGRLPYNRGTELEIFVTEMFKLAICDDGDMTLRNRLQQLLKEMPMSEQAMIRVYHEVLEHHLPEAGPYPT